MFSACPFEYLFPNNDENIYSYYMNDNVFVIRAYIPKRQMEPHASCPSIIIMLIIFNDALTVAKSMRLPTISEFSIEISGPQPHYIIKWPFSAQSLSSTFRLPPTAITNFHPSRNTESKEKAHNIFAIM